MRSKTKAADLPATIEPRIRDGVLWLVAEGKLIPGDGDRLIALVAAAAQQQDVRRVIVDLRRARLLVGPLNLNRHIAKLSGEELFASIRLAVVAAFRTNELKYFEELAAYNALHIRVFTDGVLAEQWLNETQPSMAAAS